MLSPHFIRYMTVKYKSSLEQRVVNDTTYGHTWDSAPASATALVTQTLCVCVVAFFYVDMRPNNNRNGNELRTRESRVCVAVFHIIRTQTVWTIFGRIPHHISHHFSHRSTQRGGKFPAGPRLTRILLFLEPKSGLFGRNNGKPFLLYF